MIRVVVLGGGKGQSALLRGLKTIHGIHLSAIVTVADDGGSTGRLRQEYNIPAMGDIRNVMLALAESESMLSEIMNYRFSSEKRSSVSGHNLGNLILTALTDINGNFMDAIKSVSKVLNVMGDIIPASSDLITLCAKMSDGTIVRGESNIPMYRNHIQEVFYDVDVKANPEAVKAIEEADIILFGVGSVYTSILPNIIIPEIRETIKKSNAKKIYYCNVMSQAGETEGYSAEDHVDALISHANIDLDMVVGSSDVIPEEILELYNEEHSHPVRFLNKTHVYPVMFQELLKFSSGRIEHDPEKIKNNFIEVLEVIACPLAQKLKEKFVPLN